LFHFRSTTKQFHQQQQVNIVTGSSLELNLMFLLKVLGGTKPQHQVRIKLLNMGKVMSVVAGKVQRFNV
jgi:anthranilate phosphoribosyltransferase